MVCAFFKATQEKPTAIRPLGGFHTEAFIHPGVEASARQWSSAGDQTVAEGIADQLGAVPHARLGQQMVDVGFYR